MEKIQKFSFGRLYAAPGSAKTYELIDRSGHDLTFRVWNPRTDDSWKQRAVSAYKADAAGAFEEVLFMDGVRLRSDARCTVPGTVPLGPPAVGEGVNRATASFAV